MKSLRSYVILTALSLIFVSAACRPPFLEQAIIDYNGGRIDQAYESAKKVETLAPDNPEAWYYYGKIAGEKGDYKKMIDAFDKSLSLKPDFESNIKADKSQHFSKTYNSAVQTYNGYVKLEDKESEEAKKALKSVIVDFNNALIIKDDFQACKLIALSYGYLGDEENQLKYLIKETEIAPDTAASWIDLGFYYRSKKEYGKAIEYFKKALEADPQSINANTMLAECFDFDGKKEEAIEQYKKAIEINPEEKAIPFNLGLLYYKQSTAENVEESKKMELLGEAAIYFEKVYNIDPEFKEIYDLFGLTLIHLKKFEKAKSILEEGSKYFPDAASIWSNLSYAYANLGKKNEAEEAAKRAKELANE